MFLTLNFNSYQCWNYLNLKFNFYRNKEKNCFVSLQEEYDIPFPKYALLLCSHFQSMYCTSQLNRKTRAKGTRSEKLQQSVYSIKWKSYSCVACGLYYLQFSISFCFVFSFCRNTKNAYVTSKQKCDKIKWNIITEMEYVWTLALHGMIRCDSSSKNIREDSLNSDDSIKLWALASENQIAQMHKSRV